MNTVKLTRMAPVLLGNRLAPNLPIIPLALELSPQQMQAQQLGCAAVHAHQGGRRGV
jgi:hypothetical protein